MGRLLNRAEKAQVLGLDTPNGSTRSYPLGSMEDCDGKWRWTLTRNDDGVEHRLIVYANDPSAFGAWLRDNNFAFITRKAYRNWSDNGAIATDDWVAMAKDACSRFAETGWPGLVSMSYQRTYVTKGGRVSGRWVTTSEAAHRLGVSAETVRRRIREGRLNWRRVRTASGFAYEIDMSNEPVQRHLDDAPTTSRSAPVEPLPLPVVAPVAPVPVAQIAQASSSDATQVAMLLRLFDRATPQVRAETLERLLDAALR
jgi:excisionase family DNA binding protein